MRKPEQDKDEADDLEGGPARDVSPTTFEVDLGLLLKPAELESFVANAAAAGRTPADHFLAITLGTAAKAS